MALVRLTPQKPTDAGLTQTYNAGLTTTDTFLVRNSGLVLLDFLKTGANPCTVTLIPQRTFKGKTIPNTTFVVPATTGHVSAGPFAIDLYNDVNGDLNFTLSEITGLTVAIFDLATP